MRQFFGALGDGFLAAVFVLLAFFLVAGCSPRWGPKPKPEPVVPVIASTEVGRVGYQTIYLFKARGCDYLIAERSGCTSLVHAGDCRNSIHGRRVGSSE